MRPRSECNAWFGGYSSDFDREMTTPLLFPTGGTSHGCRTLISAARNSRCSGVVSRNRCQNQNHDSDGVVLVPFLAVTFPVAGKRIQIPNGHTVVNRDQTDQREWYSDRK